MEQIVTRSELVASHLHLYINDLNRCGMKQSKWLGLTLWRYGDPHAPAIGGYGIARRSQHLVGNRLLSCGNDHLNVAYRMLALWHELCHEFQWSTLSHQAPIL